MREKIFLVALFYSLFHTSFSQSSCDNSLLSWSRGGNTITNPGSNSIGTCNAYDLILKANDTGRVTIRQDGRLFVGPKRIMANHIHSNSFMQVDGKLACKELVVVDPVKWADFVFQPQYTLLSLKELEAFYKSYRHLPDVPSEEEVKRNGINTAEMDAILLQKIEELTLYIVDLNKRLEKLEQENALLKFPSVQGK